MKLSPAIVCVLSLASALIEAGAEPSIANAARKFYPSAMWRDQSIVKGNFSCRGKQEMAILGTSKTEIVVAVFLNGLSKKPELLKYSTSVRRPDSAILTVESLDFKFEDFEREVGSVPQGLLPSKTCMGLNMSDQLIDSAHIFWNRRARRFDDWVR